MADDREISTEDEESYSEDSGEDSEMSVTSEDEVSDENSGNLCLPCQNAGDVPLEYDESAYVLLRHVRIGTPCLSFDIMQDALGDDRADKYPLSLTLVCGTQAATDFSNFVCVLKLDNMNKIMNQKSNEDDGESDPEDEDKPTMKCSMISHTGCVNRIRYTNFHGKPIAASWSEVGKVYLWDLSDHLRTVVVQPVNKNYFGEKSHFNPLFSFSGHRVEGYAMDWSPLIPGVLATGDSNKNIHLWKPIEGATWHVDQQAYAAHIASVEDIQWSPNESNVMASCSADKSIRIWDIRAAPSKACMLTTENAHDSDVNVISWNKIESFILSGGDDGVLKVWDLRRFPENSPVCTFKYHSAPITSVQWHPKEGSTFAASASDDQLTLWDLSAERDVDAENPEDISEEVLALPPQLLFIHQGQKEIKELSWHPQMPGVLVSTAQNGFNVFRTLSV